MENTIQWLEGMLQPLDQALDESMLATQEELEAVDDKLDEQQENETMRI